MGRPPRHGRLLERPGPEIEHPGQGGQGQGMPQSAILDRRSNFHFAHQRHVNVLTAGIRRCLGLLHPFRQPVVTEVVVNGRIRLHRTKITPVATYAEGATTFEVEASFVGDVVALRPGMQGAARIEVDERRLISIWTKPLVDWARIVLWRWMPS